MSSARSTPTASLPKYSHALGDVEGTAVDLDVVDRLLGVPPTYPMWRAADMANRAGILATWLSAAVARDLPITDAAHAHLTRARDRVATLRGIGSDMAAAHKVTVIKGPKIAAHYPAQLLRQSGDVDLVAPDEASLWSCATDLVDRLGAQAQGVSILDGPDGVHIGVFLKWPAGEPQLDKPMGADITTCAFSGDLRSVPVRVAMPDDEDLCSLFAVAEERFQRPYRIKDLLDFLVLAGVLEARLGDQMVDAVCDDAERLALAPELRQLLGRVDGWIELSPRWRAVRAVLKVLAKAEKAQRKPGRDGMYRLRYGYPLDDRRAAEPGVRIVARDGFDVATTPVGTCLLVTDRVIDEDVRADALAFARSLHPEGG
jgi:hypothetical protein